MGTLLEIVNRFATRTGIPATSQVITSTDAQITQIAGLLDEILEDLCTRWTWQSLTEEAHFTSVAAESQGSITAIAPNGYLRILKDTIYNRTMRLPIWGPMTESAWQQNKALFNTGPFYRYRFRGNLLLLYPQIPAGHECYFEYASSYAVTANDGTTRRSYAAADTDTFAFPDRILIAGLRWKWKCEKGLDYAEDLRRYEQIVADACAQDNRKPDLSMNSGSASEAPQPGVFVPSGSWQVSNP